MSCSTVVERSRVPAVSATATVAWVWPSVKRQDDPAAVIKADLAGAPAPGGLQGLGLIDEAAPQEGLEAFVEGSPGHACCGEKLLAGESVGGPDQFQQVSVGSCPAEAGGPSFNRQFVLPSPVPPTYFIRRLG